MQEAFEDLQNESIANGNDNMTIDEINAIISLCRQEKREEI